MIRLNGNEILVGHQYKINGRVYTVVEEHEVGKETRKWISHQFSLIGKRGAARLLEIRNSGTAYTCGWAAGSVGEVVSFEKI
jgi:hypothetical protein